MPPMDLPALKGIVEIGADNIDIDEMIRRGLIKLDL